MADTVISINNVTKIFEIPHEQSNTLKSRFLSPFKKTRKNIFKALDNVTINVQKGEILGVIGSNGSGKSTLLKTIAGIYFPSEGNIVVKGAMVPFLELGVGFNPELTGRENIFLNGTILGMTREYLEKKFNEIIEFAELEEFIDLQVKNYSSGMRVRLAFSIAVQANADIYLLDEVLSVGDIEFQKKSLNKMQKLLTGGATVILVTHSVKDVAEYCDKVVYLQDGKIVYSGETREGLLQYQLSFIDDPKERKKFKREYKQSMVQEDFVKAKDEIDESLEGRNELEKIIAYEEFKLSLLSKKDGEIFQLQQQKLEQLRKIEEQSDKYELDKIKKDQLEHVVSDMVNEGDGRAEIIEFKLMNKEEKETNRFKTNEEFTCKVVYDIRDKIENPISVFSLRPEPNINLFAVNTPRNELKKIKPLSKGERLVVEYRGRFNLNPNKYQVRVHLGDPQIDRNGDIKNRLAALVRDYMDVIIYEDSSQKGKKRDWAKNPPDWSGLVHNKFEYKYEVI